MELLDLYSDEREKTGQTIVRGDPVPKGSYLLVVHICIFNPEGQMLIQQRQPFKKGWPGRWDISVGGCATCGDTSRSAAAREVHEELGLEIDFTEIRPTLTVHFERGFDEYYVVTMPLDLNALRLQPEEVKAVRWASKEEILQMIDDDVFVPFEKSMIELLFYRRDHRSSHTKKDPSKD